MRIKPGDHVLLPFSHSVSDSEAAQIKDHLNGFMPDVKWGLIDGTPLTHALVCEDPDPASPDVLAMAKRYEAKLITALDLLDLIVERFAQAKPADEWASGMARQTEVAKWSRWIADARRMS